MENIVVTGWSRYRQRYPEEEASGKENYAENAEMRHADASNAKIMICILALENCKLSERKGLTMEFIIRRAEEEDLPGIMSIMEEARNNPQHPDWFMADDADYIREHLQGKGFGIVAEAQDGQIAGFFIVKYPEREKHLGEFLNYTESQMDQTAVMDSAAVAGAYRGHGLQKKMLQVAEREIDQKRFRYLLCTVHPENRYSLSNMTGQGYEVKAEVNCYGGRRRYVLEKLLKA